MTAYFKAHNNYFWKWEEEEEVLTIPDGSTIAYWPTVYEILKCLAPNGLPSFGTVLLAIIATNPNVDEPLAHLKKLIENRFPLPEDNLSLVLEPAIDFLKILSQLPKEYKSSNMRKQILVNVFANAHNNLSLKDSREIIGKFRDDTQRGLYYLTQSEITFPVFKRDFRPLALLLRKYPDAQSILEEFLGVSEIEESIDLPEIPENDQEPGLIPQLLQEEATAAIGHLIPHIWAGLRIPQHQRLPDEDSMGGFSDISNKGNFDRLLISEFAYDDLTFLTRLANNETLFLQRESPPSVNKESRLILIDQSLKSWGSPKLIAHAVALAIDQHPKNKRPSSIYLVGENYVPMSHENIHTVIQGVCQLEGSLDAANGLDLFFRENILSKHQEVFFLTNDKALQHPRMQKIMNEHRSKISYLLPIDQKGVCSIFSNGRQGRKLLQTLELGKLVRHHQVRTKLGKEFRFHTKNYPLLYPRVNGTQLEVNTKTKQRLIISNKKGFFVSQGDPYKALELIVDKLPPNTQLFAIGNWKTKGKVMFCMGQTNSEAFMILLKTGELITIPFHVSVRGQLKTVFLKNNFYAFTPDSAYSLEGKEELRFVKNSGISFALLREAWEEKTSKHCLFRFGAQILSKVKSIQIYENRLIVNNHPLQLDKGKMLWQTQKTDAVANPIIPNRTGKYTFEFANGNKAYVNPHGVLELISGEKQIPTIYIPLELGLPLGVATAKHFAGNQHYLSAKSPLKIIDPKDFYQNHIQSFVQKITLTHES